eukprot:CAMPEP_0168762902 /NCGR_PEP_ID=MMETSP0724-20121128/24084_1 /TAXON_ID=265536 /ORGANISM="Amphiprora sp., Strain CCMP467" /LENGTH=387 /DNA_ID=CAMNT_0008812083 /DNA_START=121 /DNA_END=1284 /DNA_ORIENTATION=+
MSALAVDEQRELDAKDGGSSTTFVTNGSAASNDNAADSTEQVDAATPPTATVERPSRLASSSSSSSRLPHGVSRKGWFTETETMWPGQKFSLALEEFSADKSILFHEQSDYQEILVFRSAQYGNVLCLDGVIQLTERDEFGYHEIMVHVPLFAHPNPRTVCVVGGGDGGCLREILRHDSVERVVLVEIDPMVVHVAKQFFASSTASPANFSDPRVEIVHQDAAMFIDQCENEFDIILGDTSDPIGPAESLFQPEFYKSMYQALRPGGIVCVQAECFWIHLDFISDLVACCADMFETAEYATTMVPTYPCGQIGFVLGCKQRVNTCRRPIQRQSSLNEQAILKQLKWYSFDQHLAAFTLPPFVLERLDVAYEDPFAQNNTDVSSINAD